MRNLLNKIRIQTIVYKNYKNYMYTIFRDCSVVIKQYSL